MSGISVLHALRNTSTHGNDPGNGGTFQITECPIFFGLRSSAAETRTLKNPDKENLIAVLAMESDGGDIVVSVESAVDGAQTITTITFDDVGDYAILVAVRIGTSDSSLRWRVLSDYGTNLTASRLTELGLTASAFEINKLDISDWFGFDEDFIDFNSTDRFTDTSADSGASVANPDAAGGIVTLTTGATNNNECYLHTTREVFKFAEGKTLFFEARLQYAEANTDDANLIVGFMDAVGADSVLDDGGGPKNTYSGVLFFKIDSGTRWNIEASIGATQTGTLELTAGNSADGQAHVAGGSSYDTLKIITYCTSSTSATAYFYINGTLVGTITFTYTGATEMHAVIGVKAGSANSEVVSVDYMSAWQKR